MLRPRCHASVLLRRPAFPLLALLPLLTPLSLRAQTADDLNEGLRLGFDAQTGAASLSWWGTAGRSYFVQSTLDLTGAWTYLPAIEQGAGAPIQYGFSVTGEPSLLFFRLILTPQTAADPYLADFDSDGIPNGWELEHGRNPLLASDAGETSSGLTWLERYQQGLGSGGDPRLANPPGLVVHTP